ncbi:MAG: hypothetical protein ABI620_07355 [Chloroflexota bacterium]
MTTLTLAAAGAGRDDEKVRTAAGDRLVRLGTERRSRPGTRPHTLERTHPEATVLAMLRVLSLLESDQRQ